MKRNSKQYPPPPPGKKYIFRASRTVNGQVQYAPPGSAFPILVDDVPSQQRPPRPVSVVLPVKLRAKKAKPQSRPVRALISRPVLALAPQPPQFVPPVRMSPVEVVPPPAPPMPNPGAHGDAHDVLGGLMGSMRAAQQAPANLSFMATFCEAFGGVAGGAGATRVSAAIGQTKPQNHAEAVEHLLRMTGNHSPEFVQAFRAQAEEFRLKRQAEAGPNGNGLAEVGYGLLEMIMHFLAGMVNGAPAGARAHLTLVNPTEDNIKKLVSNI